MQATDDVGGRGLWANLFWLSLVPFVTAWMGETDFAVVPTAAYGGVMLAASLAYGLLQQSSLARQGPESLLRRAVGSDLKGKASSLLYAGAIAGAFIGPWLAGAIFVFVALMWLVPDPRLEKAISERSQPS